MPIAIKRAVINPKEAPGWPVLQHRPTWGFPGLILSIAFFPC